MYKTKLCSSHPHCPRYYCPFAHGSNQVRYPYSNQLIRIIWGDIPLSSSLAFLTPQNTGENAAPSARFSSSVLVAKAAESVSNDNNSNKLMLPSGFSVSTATPLSSSTAVSSSLSFRKAAAAAATVHNAATSTAASGAAALPSSSLSSASVSRLPGRRLSLPPPSRPLSNCGGGGNLSSLQCSVSLSDLIASTKSSAQPPPPPPRIPDCHHSSTFATKTSSSISSRFAGNAPPPPPPKLILSVRPPFTPQHSVDQLVSRAHNLLPTNSLPPPHNHCYSSQQTCLSLFSSSTFSSKKTAPPTSFKSSTSVTPPFLKSSTSSPSALTSYASTTAASPAGFFHQSQVEGRKVFAGSSLASTEAALKGRADRLSLSYIIQRLTEAKKRVTEKRGVDDELSRQGGEENRSNNSLVGSSSNGGGVTMTTTNINGGVSKCDDDRTSAAALATLGEEELSMILDLSVALVKLLSPSSSSSCRDGEIHLESSKPQTTTTSLAASAAAATSSSSPITTKAMAMNLPHRSVLSSSLAAAAAHSAVSSMFRISSRSVSSSAPLTTNSSPPGLKAASSSSLHPRTNSFVVGKNDCAIITTTSSFISHTALSSPVPATRHFPSLSSSAESSSPLSVASIDTTSSSIGGMQHSSASAPQSSQDSRDIQNSIIPMFLPSHNAETRSLSSTLSNITPFSSPNDLTPHTTPTVITPHSTPKTTSPSFSNLSSSPLNPITHTPSPIHKSSPPLPPPGLLKKSSTVKCLNSISSFFDEEDASCWSAASRNTHPSSPITIIANSSSADISAPSPAGIVNLDEFVFKRSLTISNLALFESLPPPSISTNNNSSSSNKCATTAVAAATLHPSSFSSSSSRSRNTHMDGLKPQSSEDAFADFSSFHPGRSSSSCCSSSSQSSTTKSGRPHHRSMFSINHPFRPLVVSTAAAESSPVSRPPPPSFITPYIPSTSRNKVSSSLILQPLLPAAATASLFSTRTPTSVSSPTASTSTNTTGGTDDIDRSSAPASPFSTLGFSPLENARSITARNSHPLGGPSSSQSVVNSYSSSSAAAVNYVFSTSDFNAPPGDEMDSLSCPFHHLSTVSAASDAAEVIDRKGLATTAEAFARKKLPPHPLSIMRTTTTMDTIESLDENEEEADGYEKKDEFKSEDEEEGTFENYYCEPSDSNPTSSYFAQEDDDFENDDAQGQTPHYCLPTFVSYASIVEKVELQKERQEAAAAAAAAATDSLDLTRHMNIIEENTFEHIENDPSKTPINSSSSISYPHPSLIHIGSQSDDNNDLFGSSSSSIASKVSTSSSTANTEAGGTASSCSSYSCCTSIPARPYRDCSSTTTRSFVSSSGGGGSENSEAASFLTARDMNGFLSLACGGGGGDDYEEMWSEIAQQFGAQIYV